MAFLTNPQLDLAFDYVRNTNKNIFLTGKAGTGKTINNVAILLEKQGRNGYFRLQLPAKRACKGPGREKRAAEELEKSPWVGRYNTHKGSQVGRLRPTALYLTAPLRGSGRYNA